MIGRAWKRRSQFLFELALGMGLIFFTSMTFAADPDSANTNANAVTDTSDTSTTVADPYEKFNRGIFAFNDKIDKYILKPIATFYNKVMPHPLARGIRNFFFNIDTVPTVINDALQANFYQTTRDAWRLGINSTVGILGFFDVAKHMGLAPNREDFGLTLARWGYERSNYLVLPFFGPSTPRDTVGLPVDYYVFSVYPHIHPASTRYELYGAGIVSRRAELLSFENVMQQAALDRYVFVRDAYMQRRAWLIERNKELNDPYLESDNSNEKNSQKNS